MSRKKDGSQKVGQNGDVYEQFLNTECTICFRWYVKRNKSTTWCDLTGPEKNRLFSNIDIPRLFPDLHTKTNYKRSGQSFLISLRNW